MKRGIHTVVVALAVLFASTSAFAQGGGASTTGSINGKIVDNTGAVLPGVTVTAASPSLMGVQTSVSDTSGNYRFPALPPGTYTVTFELPGFNKLERQNIQIAMGFTATVNVELAVATVQETVTVTGASPVIDTSNTRVQQNFKLEALQEIPNSRDMWSLLAVTPAVNMQRIDVGGNRAGTQTTYYAYGYSGQNRVLVEGINTTEGTSGAGFYFDYGSFEEVFLGTIGQGAEMPTPGVQSQFLGKSGGNKFQGEIYQDFENNSMQGANISADALARGIREHSNEINKYRDFNINVGGPIKKDKVWWYFSHRDQFTSVQQPNFIGALAGQNFDTHLWNPSGKVTYQINQNNKLIGYYQWGQKKQPNRTPSSSYSYTDVASTFTQNSGSWVYKGEWNGTISNSLYAEARYGVFGYYFPLIANGDPSTPEIINNQLSQYFGADEKEQTDRHRGQATGAVTYFKDALGGTHNIKVGGEYLMENQYVGYLQVASGGGGGVRETIGTNGRPTTVAMYAPTATNVGGILSGPNGELLSVANLTTSDFFVTDQFTIGRATMNLGARYDHYSGWTPDQQQLAYTFPTGVSIPATTIAKQTYFTWNKIVPRLGLSYDLAGDGKTVLKLNFGRYGFNPGPGIASSANPNQSVKSLTYAWTDTKACPGCIAGDGLYQPGEEGNLTGSALAGNIQVDPGLFQPMSTQATAYVERQLTADVGARVGFVYYTVNDQIEQMQGLRPASAYTVPFTVTDPVTNNALTFYGIPNSAISGCSASVTTPTPTCLYPTTNIVMNVPENGKYKTIEASLNKRMSHGFSAGGGYGYTWSHDFPLTFNNTPNGPFDYDYTSANFKANAQYALPWGGVMLSAVYRYQLGSNYARTLSVSAPASCNCTFSAARGGSSTNLANTTVYATSYDAYRQDNISVFDLRGEKTLSFSQVKLRLFVDGFNLTNSGAAETISVTTGANFQRPTAILGPRTARIGARFIW